MRKSTFPPYPRKQHRSGQARIAVAGQTLYLGAHGSPESYQEYARLQAEWVANGQLLPRRGKEALVVEDALAAYWTHAERKYATRNSTQLRHLKTALGFVRRTYGHVSCTEFGPRSLKAVRVQMEEKGYARSYINRLVLLIKACFAWCALEEVIPAEVYHRLIPVKALQHGETTARDDREVIPVSQEIVNATLPHCSAAVADLIRLQLLTAMRPGEATILRACDMTMTGDVWTYRPPEHKSKYKGIGRVVYLGPQAQSILRPRLQLDTQAHLFLSQRRTRFTVSGYRQAIVTACKRAGVERWHPHQLRHAAATRIRAEFGLDAAQIALGHSTADTTQIYAQADTAKVVEAMRKLG